jgi:hypothetical protein
MQFQDVYEYVRRRPFEPFRLTLTDGRTYDVTHPELVMVGLSSVAIGFPAREHGGPPYDRVVSVSMSHIMQIEPVQHAAGQSPA